MTDTPLVECSAGYGSGPFKYGYCHEGMCGPCCAPRIATVPVMTWPEWKRERNESTVFLFRSIPNRPSDRAIIVYDTLDGEGCYERVDSVTMRPC